MLLLFNERGIFLGRLMGLDYGEKRIGVALSDPTNILVSPHSIIKRENFEKDIDKIIQICNEYLVIKIIIGLPLNNEGKEGFQAKRIRNFVEKLKKKIEIPIEFIDESFSSIEAESLMIKNKKSRLKRKKDNDKIAASIILQNYIKENK